MNSALRAQLADYFDRLLLGEETEQSGEEIADRVIQIVAASMQEVEWKGTT